MSDAAGIRRPAALVRRAAADQEKNNGGQLAGTDGSASSAFERSARRCARGHEGVSAIAQAALAPKALDTKTKELVALGISVAIRCDDCIAFHVKAALDHGATRDEVLETLGTAIYLGAGPSVMYASHAVAALAQFEAVKSGQVA